MLRHARAKLSVRPLEDRITPATTAFINFYGDLVVSATAASNIVITETAQGAFNVTDNGLTIGTFANVFRDVRVFGSAADDNVTVDLGGFSTRDVILLLGDGNNTIDVHNGVVDFVTITGFGTWWGYGRGGFGNDNISLSGLSVLASVAINTGDGTNSVTITDTAISGGLGIFTGTGNDTVVLSGATSANFTQVIDYGGPNDSLTVNSGVILNNLYTSAVNFVTLVAGSHIVGYVTDYGGANTPNSLTIGGMVDGNVFFGGSGAADTLDLAAGATVGGNVRTYLYGGNDVVTLDGNFAGNLYIDAGAGNDSISFNGQSGLSATIYLGDGNDTFTLNGTVGASGFTTARLSLSASYGNDQVTLSATSVINGSASINMGPGNDTATVDAAARFITAFIDGWYNTDTFAGNKTHTGLTLKNFEVFI
jgi:hypothetical protein